MKRSALVSLAILSISVVPAFASAQDTPPRDPSAVRAPRPHEEVIKLWKANLSEDFIKRQILAESTVYDLSADDVIACRDAGLPESLINVMLDTRHRSASAPAAAPAAVAPAPAPVAAQAPAPMPAQAFLAAEANRRWEGLARRQGGVVVFKNRWSVGVLEFKEETLRWIDAKDAGKSLLIPGRGITEQFLTCLKKAGGNECFEWGFKTTDGEYRFRDVAWKQGENAKVMEIFEFMKAVYPSLVSSTVPVDDK